MQVLTLDPTALDRQAARLARMVEEDSTDLFDAIVAVKRGGSFVCDAFCRHFPKERYGARYDVTLQRPSTKRKNGVVSRMLKRLPLCILDIMRMAESSMLSLQRKVKGAADTATVELPEGLEKILKEKGNPKILVIDDAIDSGNTLSAIVNTLREMNNTVKVCIAVMTETTRDPGIRADYSLYRNRTLIRFPWSNDYKTR